MTGFAAFSALLLVAVVLSLVSPLRRASGHIHRRSADELRLDIYRSLLAELSAERRRGLLTDAQFDRERDDLEQRLVADFAPTPPPLNSQAGNTTSVLRYALVVGVPVAAVLLYLFIGAPHALVT